MARQLRIDQICDHYRNAWRCGKPRPIEELLATALPQERAEVLVELLVMEAQLRGAAGDAAIADEYRRRFPRDLSAVARALAVLTRRLQPLELDETKAFSGSHLPGTTLCGDAESTITGPYEDAAGAARQAAFPEMEGYELLEEIGRGGMGVVYKARQKRLGRLVALKVIRTDHAPRPEDIQRFEREAAAAARLDHPGIVAVYDAGRHNGWPFYVMAYVAGRSLAARIGEGPLPVAEAVGFARQIAQAIGYAHRQGVVHRDLKPANVLVDQEGRIRIADFGLAKLLDSATRITASGMLIGSFPFMAPEQAMGRNELIGPATDIHAVGVILYSMLVGHPPFGGHDPVLVLDQVKFEIPRPVSTFRSDVDSALNAIIQRCLAKSPARRFASAEELAAALEAYRQGSGEPAGGLQRVTVCLRKNVRRLLELLPRRGRRR